MVTRIQRWGNSLALRIPSAFAVQAKIAEGAAVDIVVEDDRLVVKPVHHRYRLRDLLNAIDSRNRHAEVSTGSATGKEIW